MHEHDVAGRPSGMRATEMRVVGQAIRALAVLEDDLGPVDLEVVVVLGVELRRPGSPTTRPRGARTAPLAASPASFQPSKAQSITGSTSSGRLSGRPSNSINGHPRPVRPACRAAPAAGACVPPYAAALAHAPCGAVQPARVRR